MKINKELLKGSTSILILTLLNEKDMYGYQITQEMKKRSNEVFDLKEGTLYPMLHSLEKQGAVDSYWFDTKEGRRRKYYKITEEGAGLLREKQQEWKVFAQAMNGIIKEDCYEWDNGFS